MARLESSYDVNDLPKPDSTIPAGLYMAVVKKTEQKKTKSGTGAYISIQWDILGPTHQGRVVFDMITIKNESAAAVDIGNKQMSGLLTAFGMVRLEDDEELIGHTCQIKVALSKAQEGYEPKNEVKAYKAPEGGAMPMASIPKAPAFAAPAFAAPVTPPAAAAPASAPWLKK